MFPHSDTVYTVHGMRLQDELQYAARQRLAATAREAARIQPVHVAVSESLNRVANRLRERLRNAVTSPVQYRPREGAGQSEVAGTGLA